MDGKFIALGAQRLWLRGATYGTFAPDGEGARFGTREQVRHDFAAMAASGFNTVRTYTAPPEFVLDEAAAHGLWVMAGLAWEQHVAFLDEPGRAASIEESVHAQTAACAGHPGLLCFAVGNEIPTPLVRWHGRRRVEAFLERLANAVRDEAPDTLLTYVNYPSTEYLRLPFLDLVAFNLYLDQAAAVEAYLARLQNLAGDKPLVLAELGADSVRSGPRGQAETLAGQIEIAAASGCAGTYVFAWTDEWHRGEDEVLDWHFGLTDRARRPKPALAAVAAAYARAETIGLEDACPHISVVVCTHNGARRLPECLAAITALRYPSYETIVVDDGSTDATAEIAATYDVRLIRTEQRGLSAARNVGLAAARGEIVAYIDDDAYPDVDWLRFLAAAFRSSGHAAIGGPNVPPRARDAVVTCLASAPGGPVPVLVSDAEAEHLPGCNLAFRRSALLAIGAFDPQFRTAGDDVDVCWRLLEAGESLGFHAGAAVWHHRRDSVRGYLRQQWGYGHAEALLERKWPEKYTRRGHLSWRGRLYDSASPRAFRPQRIYHGTWGTGAFQPAEDDGRSVVADAVAAPDWYLLIAALAAVTALGGLWGFLAWAAVPLGFAAAASFGLAAAAAARTDLGADAGRRGQRVRLRALLAALHLLQPAARLAGRLSRGLAPWRRHRTHGFAAPRRRVCTSWYESWRPARERVARLEEAARRTGARVVRGGPYARFDLELSGGALGAARVLVAVEEHGRDRQLVRCRISPRLVGGAWHALAWALALAVVGGLADGPSFAALALVAAGLVAAAAAWEAGLATATALAAVDATGSVPHDVRARGDAAREGAPRQLVPVRAEDA